MADENQETVLFSSAGGGPPPAADASPAGCCAPAGQVSCLGWSLISSEDTHAPGLLQESRSSAVLAARHAGLSCSILAGCFCTNAAVLCWSSWPYLRLG